MLTATRVSTIYDNAQRTAPTPVEDAFSVVQALQPLEGHERWRGGRRVFGGAFSAGTVSILDLREPVEVVVRGAVQAVQYYVTRSALDDFVLEAGLRPVSTLTNDRSALDRVLSQLGALLLSSVPDSRPENRLYTDGLGLGLVAHLVAAYGGVASCRPDKGGLAPWQERRARDLLAARLADGVSMAEIARECGLTQSHFARAFRESFGKAPHAYLIAMRLERARALMRGTDLQLAEIALLSGFGDQSYFTRLFTRETGTSPGQWRRDARR